MTINIKNFKVTDLTSGKMEQSGRKTQEQLNVIKSQDKFKTSLVEQQAVPGTPTIISSGPLLNSAHMSTKYINISRENGKNSIDSVFIPTIIRIIKLSGYSAVANMICYAFANSPTQLSENLEWNVLFANFNEQTEGDYVDISLPDSTLYPKLYLGLILLNNAWLKKTIVNETQKICSIPSNLKFFCINPSYSNADVGLSHVINIQAYNTYIGYQNRLCVAFEDYYSNVTDRDYNDVVLSIQDRDFDENAINDFEIY